jgi:hypothetical protein
LPSSQDANNARQVSRAFWKHCPSLLAQRSVWTTRHARLSRPLGHAAPNPLMFLSHERPSCRHKRDRIDSRLLVHPLQFPSPQFEFNGSLVPAFRSGPAGLDCLFSCGFIEPPPGHFSLASWVDGELMGYASARCCVTVAGDLAASSSWAYSALMKPFWPLPFCQPSTKRSIANMKVTIPMVKTPTMR